MGKKTNWTIAEDQTLCRAWLHASDSAQLQAPEHKAATFWSAVHQLFHAELDTTVERPVNGLKIRWTRINRDVQKFALIHVSVLANHAKASDTDANAAIADPAVEAQLIDEAKSLFQKEREAKFQFEECWKQLRYSHKWLMNLSNSTGAAVTVPPHADGAFLGSERPARMEDAGSVASSADAFRLASSLATGQKRRANGLLDVYASDPMDQQSGVLSALVDELRRRNELLEEQNAISLFRLDADMVDQEDARAYFALLRQRYLKKMRLAVAVSDQLQPGPSASSSQFEASAATATASAVHTVGARPMEAVDPEHEEEEKSVTLGDADMRVV